MPLPSKLTRARAADLPPAERKQLARELLDEADYDEWLRAIVPDYVGRQPVFAPHHDKFWSWVWEWNDEAPRPFIACWPRGGAKTVSAQLATVRIATTGLRPYGIYVSALQANADDKVADIGRILLSRNIEAVYPEVARRFTSETGLKRDWRRSRIRTESGFTLDALGLGDTAARGIKIDEDRPSFLILDDIESKHDTPGKTQKKIETLTASILPALTANAIVIFIQNKITSDSIMAQVIDGRADYLATRIVSGPIPALRNFAFEEREQTDDDDRRFVITSGEPTWEKLTVEACEAELNRFGPEAFAAEKQHETDIIRSDRFPTDKWVMVDRSEWPAFIHVCRAWDLAASDSKDADYTVGVLMGLDRHFDPWILDVTRGQWTVSEVEAEMVERGHDDEDRLGMSVPIVIEKQIGTAQKHYERRWKRVLADFTFHYADPLRKKDDRADAIASRQQREEVRLTNATWNAAFKRELALFPNKAKNDDQVDAAAHAFNWLMSKMRDKESKATTATDRVLPTRGAGRLNRSRHGR